jgi:hypothetical protein
VTRTRIHLSNIGHILRELGAQYRRADRGELPWSDAAAAARILREMRLCIESSDIEQQIGEIISAMDAAGISIPKPPRGNGRWESRL